MPRRAIIERGALTACRLATVAALLVAASGGATPPTVVPQDPLLLAEGLRAARRGELVAPEAPDRARSTPLPARVVLDGASRALSLNPMSLRAATCVLEVTAPDGARRQESLPPPTLWVDGSVDRTVVSVSADGLRWTGIGHDVEGPWSFTTIGTPSAPAKVADPASGTVAPERAIPILAARPLDSIPQPMRCGTSAAEVAVAPPASAPAETPPRCPRRWSVALELDSAAVERFGGRREDAIAAVELLLAAAAGELSRTAAVDLVIDRIVCLDAPAPAEPVGAGALYAEIWSRWSARPEAERPASVIHLTGRTLADGAFGLGWIGGVAGGPAQRSAVVGVAGPTSLLGRSASVLHILAHLLGADHCGDACGLMSAAWLEPPAPRLDDRAAMQTLALVQARNALPAQPLASPTNVTASDGARCEGVEVSWNSVPAATSYEVLRGLDTDGAPMQVLATVPGPPWLDTAASPATPFRYRVQAVDACRRSEPSAADVGFAPAPVTAPASVSASDGAGCADTTITWAEVPHAKAYEILRNPVNNAATAGAIGRSEQARFVDAAPPPGVVWYWVRALDACGRSGPVSRGDSGFVGGLPPAPTGIAATDGTACGTVILTWNAVAGATAYAIWRSTTPDLGQGSQLAEVQTSPFEDGAAPAGAELFYWVRALSPCGKGPFGGPDRGRAAGSVPRIASIGDVLVPCGQPYQGPTPALSNAECAVPVEWSIAGGPAGLLIAADGTVQWPSPVVGSHAITIAARNESGVGQEQWTVQVQPLAPTLAAMPAASVRCGEPMRLAAPVVTNAACAGPVQWSIDAPPSGAAIAADGVVTWTPAAPATSTLTIVAANPAGSGTTTCAIAVTPASPQLDPPGPASAVAGVPWSGQAPIVRNASCTGKVRWILVRAPEGVTLAADGAPSWQRPLAGSFELAIKAVNDAGDSECTCRLTVVARPAPTISTIADASTPCGAAWTGPTPLVANAEAAGPVAWSIARSPEGAVVDANGVIRWPAPRLGRHDFVLKATGEGGVAEEAFVLTVAPIAPPPINSVPDADLVEGAAYEVVLSLPEEFCTGPVTWRIVEGPDGLVIDDRGVAKWPAVAKGSHQVRARARNAAGESEVQWRIEVTAETSPEDRRYSPACAPRLKPTSCPDWPSWRLASSCRPGCWSWPGSRSPTGPRMSSRSG